MEGDWACALVKWDQQQSWNSLSELALVSIYFSSGISSALFLQWGCKVRDPMKDLSKTFVSLAEWLPGEAVFLFP